MDVAVIVAIISVVVISVSVLVAVLQYRENHSDHKDVKLDIAVKKVVREEIKPMQDEVAHHAIQVTQNASRLDRIEELLKDISLNQRDFADKQSQMGVKVDMYWSTLEQLAMNSAKGLHQPDPRRDHIDKLLESFMEGTLTPEERIELKKILVTIRNFEPGQGHETVGFPVYPGEQTFATILLSTMDVVQDKMATMGHTAHRSAAHFNRKDR